MTQRLTEAKESEASKQAKLKGYQSIGFGRWADKFGNLVAFTTKTGRLAPYDKKPDAETKSSTDDVFEKPSDDFIQSFTKQKTQPSNQYRSDAQVNKRIPTEKLVDSDTLQQKFSYYADKYAAEAMLMLLKQMRVGNLDTKEMAFYTSPEFLEYADSMSRTVVALDTALSALEKGMAGQIKRGEGKLSLSLGELYGESGVENDLLHIMLMDLKNEGPSLTFANAMLLYYASSVREYDEKTGTLVFDYNEVEEPEAIIDPNDPIEQALQHYE